VDKKTPFGSLAEARRQYMCTFTNRPNVIRISQEFHDQLRMDFPTFTLGARPNEIWGLKILGMMIQRNTLNDSDIVVVFIPRERNLIEQ